MFNKVWIKGCSQVAEFDHFPKRNPKSGLTQQKHDRALSILEAESPSMGLVDVRQVQPAIASLGLYYKQQGQEVIILLAGGDKQM